MAISDPYVDVTCDNCKTVARVEGSSSQLTIHRLLTQDGWYVSQSMNVESKHYCPKCYGSKE